MGDVRQNIDPFQESFFSIGNRAARFLWGMVWLLLFRPSPRPFHFWRATLLRLFGAKLGKDCHVYPGARIWAPWNLEMGDNASLADGVICYSMAKISLGEKAIVSQGAHLLTGTHDYTDPRFQLLTKPIVIGKQAWLCADSMVLPGVEIGEGAVLGARAVATRNIPAWTLCAGNPCREIKKRELKS